MKDLSRSTENMLGSEHGTEKKLWAPWLSHWDHFQNLKKVDTKNERLTDLSRSAKNMLEWPHGMVQRLHNTSETFLMKWEHHHSLKKILTAPKGALEKLMFVCLFVYLSSLSLNNLSIFRQPVWALNTLSCFETSSNHRSPKYFVLFLLSLLALLSCVPGTLTSPQGVLPPLL